MENSKDSGGFSTTLGNGDYSTFRKTPPILTINKKQTYTNIKKSIPNPDLILLEVLMNESDYNLIISLKNKKDLTEADFCLCGDVLISNLRSFCR